MLFRLFNFSSHFLLPLFKNSFSKTKTIHNTKFRFSSSTALAQSSTSETHFTKPSNSSSFHPNTSQILQKLHLYRNNPSLALSYFSELKNQHGFSHNIQTYVAIIRILCYWNLNRRLDSLFRDIIISHSKQNPLFEIHDLFEKLLEGVHVKDKNHYLLRAFVGFVKACVGLNMFDDAIDFMFMFQIRRFGILPNIFACNFLINRLVKCDQVNMAFEIFDRIKSLGLCPNHHTYAIIIKALGTKGGDLKQASAVFDEMKEAGVTPNSYCYAAYIEGLCNNHQSDLGYDLLRALRENNAPIDVYAYTAVIRGFCNEMKLDKAMQVFYDMEWQRLVPGCHVYSSLICGYCKTHDLVKALDLYEDMILKGIKTNCVIVSCILHCFAEMGEDSRVVDTFKEVKQSGVFLDGVAYNIVFDSLFKLGKMDEVAGMLEDLKSMHIDFDIKHYTTFIKGYCLQGKPDKAYIIFKEMEEKGFKPDVVAYNVLAAGLCGNRHVSEAMDLLNYMDSQGVKPNSTTHKIIIEGFCSEGKIEEAEGYFNSMKDVNSMKDESVEIYTAMVNGYCEADLIEKSYELFHELSNRGDTAQESSCLKQLSKVLYSKVLAELCQKGNMQRARSLFDFFLGRGFTPDVVTYTIMIKSYCTMNCLHEAHDLFQDMKSRGIKPDVITYTVLLDGKLKQARSKEHFSSQHGKGKDAPYDVSTIWRDMKDREVSPDVVIYTVLIDGHIKVDNFEDAIRLFNEVMKRGLEPDNVTYTALFSGLLNSGHSEIAVTLYNEMSSKGMTPPSHINQRILKVRKLQFQSSTGKL